MEISLKDKHILLGITGGIAAYKTPEIVRLIIKAGGEVRVIMTEAGTKFVSVRTLATLSGNAVYTKLFPKKIEGTLHLDLARWADALVIAPATANIIAKAAVGIADDLLSTILLAVEKPLMIVPAMNTSMYNHPTVQNNLKILRNRGVQILEPESGPLATLREGEGIGRMPEPVHILEWINAVLSGTSDKFKGIKILITAGPTLEAIDPVRFISNFSSGKMGYALAEEAVLQGAEVTLISGSVALKPPLKAKLIQVRTSEEMLKAVKVEFPSCQIAIMSAAVADFKPVSKSRGKIKKSPRLTLELVPTQDILKWMGEHRREQFIVGFALEDKPDITEARRKLERKKADLMVLNPPKALSADANKAIFVTSGSEEILPLMSKRQLAQKILARIHAQMDLKSE